MNIVYTLLVACALGFFVRQRATAIALYLAGGAFVFAFQSVNLVIEWIGGSESAFGPYPDSETSKVFGYGLFNFVVTLVGIGLVVVGAKVSARRGERQKIPAEVAGA